MAPQLKDSQGGSTAIHPDGWAGWVRQGRLRSICALAMVLGFWSATAGAQMADPPDPGTCPKGFSYHARDDDCVPIGATVGEPPALARKSTDKWSKTTAECILQHIDKAHVGAAVEPIIKACQALDDQ